MDQCHYNNTLGIGLKTTICTQVNHFNKINEAIWLKQFGLNITHLYTITKDILISAILTFVIIFMISQINDYVKKYYETKLKNYQNYIKLSHQSILSLILDVTKIFLCDFVNCVFMFIAITQYLCGKYINIYLITLQILLQIFFALKTYIGDYNDANIKNSTKYTILTKWYSKYYACVITESYKIKSGDYILLDVDKPCPVTKAKILGYLKRDIKDCVSYFDVNDIILDNSNKFAINVCPKNGEYISELYKCNDTIIEGMSLQRSIAIKKDFPLVVQVTDVERLQINSPQNLNCVHDLIKFSTYYGLLVISIIAFHIIASEFGDSYDNILMLEKCMLYLIGTICGFNQLLPPFKIFGCFAIYNIVLMILRDNKFIKKYGYTGGIYAENNQAIKYQRNDTNKFEPFKYINGNEVTLFTDKTGTLTLNDMEIECIHNISDETLFIQSIGAMFTFWEKNSTNREVQAIASVEEKVFGKYVDEKFNLKINGGNNILDLDFFNKDGIKLHITSDNVNTMLYLNARSSYQYDLRGRHALFTLDHKTYFHLVMFGSDVIAKISGAHQLVHSLNRGLALAYKIITKNDNTDLQTLFDSSVEAYVLGVKNHEKVDDFHQIFEYHLNDPLRPNTFNGIHKLKQAGVKIRMLTGDSILTGTYIGITSGMFANISETQITQEYILDTLDKFYTIETLNMLEFAKLNKYEFIAINGTLLDKIKTNIDEEQFVNLLQSFDNCVLCRFSEKHKQRIIDMHKKYTNKIIVMVGDGVNDKYAIENSNLSFAIDKSPNEVKKVSNVIVRDLESVYYWIFTMRNLLIYGKRWLFTYMQAFNYFSAGIYIVGLHGTKFAINKLIFDDPWHSGLSSIISTTITIMICLSILKLNKSFYSGDYFTEKQIKIINVIISFVSVIFGLLSGYVFKNNTNLNYAFWSLYSILAYISLMLVLEFRIFFKYKV
jgi:hypothetical protein